MKKSKAIEIILNTINEDFSEMEFGHKWQTCIGDETAEKVLNLLLEAGMLPPEYLYDSGGGPGYRNLNKWEPENE